MLHYDIVRLLQLQKNDGTKILRNLNQLVYKQNEVNKLTFTLLVLQL